MRTCIPTSNGVLKPYSPNTSPARQSAASDHHAMRSRFGKGNPWRGVIDQMVQHMRFNGSIDNGDVDFIVQNVNTVVTSSALSGWRFPGSNRLERRIYR